MIHTQTRTARKTRRCGRCLNRIRPGDRYLRHTAAPHDNDLGNEGWMHATECAGCAAECGRPIAAQTSDESATTREGEK